MGVILFFTVFIGLWVILGMIRLSRSTGSKPRYSSSLLQDTPKMVFEFPDHDETGHRRIRISTFTLTGAIYPHFGYNPQTTIPRVRVGERVFLRPEVDNEFDNTAISIHTITWKFLGWIPSGSNKDIFNRLVQGQTVLARVSELGSYVPERYYDYDGNYKDNIYNQYSKVLTCTVEVALYSSKFEKVTENN